MITYLLISLIFFFLGRYTATNRDIEKAKEIFRRNVKDRIGTVKRPTAEAIRKKGTVLEETEEAMEETFDKIIK